MLWVLDWEFCRDRDCLYRPERVVVLRDRSSTDEWLLPFKKDVFKMLATRTFLAQDPRGARQFSSMSDDAIMDHVAELLVSGRLHIHALFEQEPPGGTSSVAIDAPPAPFPLSQRKAPPIADRPPISDPPTFSDIDGAAQAATLVAAAAAGAPFCPE
jgi:hypothetical protein